MLQLPSSPLPRQPPAFGPLGLRLRTAGLGLAECWLCWHLGHGAQSWLGNYRYLCVKVHKNALFHIKYLINFLGWGAAV